MWFGEREGLMHKRETYVHWSSEVDERKDKVINEILKRMNESKKEKEDNK